MEPASQQLWTKHLDIHFATIVQLVHGDKVCHSRDSNEATTVWHWEEVLKHLVQDKNENWPEPLASIEALKKRWKLFRTWYAKAYSAPDVQYENDINVPRLIRRLQERNYEEEGRRGRRKGPLWKRKKSIGEDSLEETDVYGNDSTIEGVELLAEVSSLPTPSSISPIRIQDKKKLRSAESTTKNSDPRLEAWLSVLQNPVVQKNFKIHTHSDIVLEPELLLNIIRDPFASLLQLAQSFAPLEWVSRILDPSDQASIQERVTQKKNFFILPSEASTVLLILVHFPLEAKEQPLFWIFRAQGEYEEDHEKITAALGFPVELFHNFQWKFTPIGEAKSVPLYLFSICLSHLLTGNLSNSGLEEKLSTVWPEPEVIRRIFLTKILLDNSSTGLQIAPPREPLQFQYASLLDAIQAYGVSSPSWFIGFAADKRQEFLEAIRDITNTVVFVIDMSKPKPFGNITWKRQSTDKSVLLIAEKNGQFGGILRLKQSDDKTGATLSLLAKRNSISKLQVNGSVVKNEEYVLRFRTVDAVIRCTVNDVLINLVCTS